MLKKTTVQEREEGWEEKGQQRLPLTVIANALLGPRRRSQASSLHNLRCRDLHVCAILQHISAAFVIISLAFVLHAKQENAGSETGPREEEAARLDEGRKNRCVCV